jgi:hypothetical protein
MRLADQEPLALQRCAEPVDRGLRQADLGAQFGWRHGAPGLRQRLQDQKRAQIGGNAVGFVVHTLNLILLPARKKQFASIFLRLMVLFFKIMIRADRHLPCAGESHCSSTMKS